MAARFDNPGQLWKLKTFLLRPRKLLEILRDKRSPFIAKALPVLAILYLLFPIDILPDFLPFIGQIDDLTVTLYLLSLALDFVPDSVFRAAGITLPKVREVKTG